MGLTNEILLVLLISIIASSQEIDLFTNCNFLLLLLLCLSSCGGGLFGRRGLDDRRGFYGFDGCGCGCR